MNHRCTPLPWCAMGFDGVPEGSDILSRIFAGVVAYRRNMSCYNKSYNPIETSEG